MIGMKKLQDISDEAYVISSNGNACVLPLTFKFLSGFVIPDAIKYNLIPSICFIRYVC